MMIMLHETYDFTLDWISLSHCLNWYELAIPVECILHYQIPFFSRWNEECEMFFSYQRDGPEKKWLQLMKSQAQILQMCLPTLWANDLSLSSSCFVSQNGAEYLSCFLGRPGPGTYNKTLISLELVELFQWNFGDSLKTCLTDAKFWHF